MLSVCDPAAHHGLSSPPARGKRAAAKTDSARRPPPTCPEVSGLVEVTPTFLPALCPKRRRDGSEHKIGGHELLCWRALVNEFSALIYIISMHINYS